MKISTKLTEIYNRVTQLDNDDYIHIAVISDKKENAKKMFEEWHGETIDEKSIYPAYARYSGLLKTSYVTPVENVHHTNGCVKVWACMI